MISVAELVDRAARQYGSRVAVEDGRRQLTFVEVADRSRRLASTLSALVATDRSRVAILLPNCVEYVECDLAIATAQLVRAPINPRLTDDERRYVLAHCGAEVLIVHEQFAEGILDMWKELPELRSVVVVGERAFPGTLAYADALAGQPATFSRTIPGEHPSFILYTSGTTGRPKGALSTHAGRLAATQNMLINELDASVGDGFVHTGSMAHGSGSKVLAHLVRGARNIPMVRFDPDQFVQLAGELRATGTFMVPTMIAMLLDVVASSSERLAQAATLRTVSYGGAPSPHELMCEALEALGPIFVQVYGSCEAPHPVTVLSKWEHQALAKRPGGLETIGREAWGTAVKLAGESDSTGELCVKGPNVLAGYWNDPVETARVLEDGWYRTGDVATRNEDGLYRIVDRVRDMIITGGLNVYPAEVERVIRDLPTVADVAVIGVPDDRWGEAVMAFVVPAPDGAVTAADVIEHCARFSAGYKKPRHVEIVTSLPLGSTGKILKRELRDRYWKGVDRHV